MASARGGGGLPPLHPVGGHQGDQRPLAVPQKADARRVDPGAARQVFAGIEGEGDIIIEFDAFHRLRVAPQGGLADTELVVAQGGHPGFGQDPGEVPVRLGPPREHPAVAVPVGGPAPGDQHHGRRPPRPAPREPQRAVDGIAPARERDLLLSGLELRLDRRRGELQPGHAPVVPQGHDDYLRPLLEPEGEDYRGEFPHLPDLPGCFPLISPLRGQDRFPDSLELRERHRLPHRLVEAVIGRPRVPCVERGHHLPRDPQRPLVGELLDPLLGRGRKRAKHHHRGDPHGEFHVALPENDWKLDDVRILHPQNTGTYQDVLGTASATIRPVL